MFLTTLATIGVISVLFLLIRYRAQMAQLIAWIIGTIFHRQKIEKATSVSSSPNKSVKNTKHKDNKKSKKPGTSQRAQKGKLDVNILVDKQIQKEPKPEPETVITKTTKSKNKKPHSPIDSLDSKKVKVETKVKIEKVIEGQKPITVQKHVHNEYKEKQIKENKVKRKQQKDNTETTHKTDLQNKEITKPLKIKDQRENKQKAEKIIKDGTHKEVDASENRPINTTQQHTQSNKETVKKIENKKEIKLKITTNTEQKEKTINKENLSRVETETAVKTEKVVTSKKAQKEDKVQVVDRPPVFPKTQKTERNTVTVKLASQNTQEENTPNIDKKAQQKKQNINKESNVNILITTEKVKEQGKVNTAERRVASQKIQKENENKIAADAVNLESDINLSEKKESRKSINVNLSQKQDRKKDKDTILDNNKTSQKIKKDKKSEHIVDVVSQQQIQQREKLGKSLQKVQEINTVETHKTSVNIPKETVNKYNIDDGNVISQKKDQSSTNSGKIDIDICEKVNKETNKTISVTSRFTRKEDKVVDVDKEITTKNIRVTPWNIQKESEHFQREDKNKIAQQDIQEGKNKAEIDTTLHASQDINQTTNVSEHIEGDTSITVSYNIEEEQNILKDQIVSHSTTLHTDSNKAQCDTFSDTSVGDTPNVNQNQIVEHIEDNKSDSDTLNDHQNQIIIEHIEEDKSETLNDHQNQIVEHIEENKSESDTLNDHQNQIIIKHIEDDKSEGVTNAIKKIEEQSTILSQKTVSDTDSHTFPERPKDLEKDSTKFNSEETYSKMKEITHVRVLTLNDGEHTNSTLYRIENEWTLQFRLGPSLFGRKVALYCNYPSIKDGQNSEFNRNRYFLVPFKQDEGCSYADDTALFAEISVQLAGSFHYYFVYENATEPCPQGSGYFLVDPVLSFQNENLPLNCIQCQTVQAKCLGPFSTWENKLKVAKESGYNMIHFTPIQELGKSNSSYSLSAQLKLNPSFNDNSKKITFADIENFTQKMRTEWKVLSICDIVLNHTANETDWLQEHPESTYNCLNCPYMRPAYLLDVALHQFSLNVEKGVYETEGIPPEVCTEDHINAIRYVLFTKVLPEIKLQEMYICNVSKLVSEFLDLARKNPSAPQIRIPDREIKLIRDPLYRRLSATVDMELALELYNVYRCDVFDEDTRLKRCGEEFKYKLDQLNKDVIEHLNKNLNAAVENCIAGIRYDRVQADGPKIVDISIDNPLSFRYFTDYGNPKSIEEFEEIMYGPNSKYLMAHNGWVMDADPMKNFADPESDVYIRRELIAWGDSVKLRFGDKPEDSPFLWNHMKEYVELTAKIFDGVRLDNCHSTPIPVAEYLLDCARRVRPNLYVVAELFTNSDHTDNVFVNRLGITSLIREAMSAWDSHEEGRLVYRYGGEPVGAFFQPHFRPLMPSVAHALFLDLTHDNPSPVEKRSVFDLLPSSALVNMACCASGSNRGYDELVNHHIHVVNEKRQYTEWTNDENLAINNAKYVSYKSGIISAKRALNDLHYKLGEENFSQVYVDQVDKDIVTVTRHCPDTHQSVILVAFTAFNHPNVHEEISQRPIKPLVVEGNVDEIIFEATLSHNGIRRGGLKYSSPQWFVKDDEWINGLSEYEVDIKQHIQIENSGVFEVGQSNNSNVTQLNFKHFKPGSVVAIRVSLQKHVEDSICKLRELLLSFSKKSTTDLQKIVGQLDLNSLNRALYRCDKEEQDEGKGFGAYNIPKFGSLVYCGLQGFMSLLSTIRPSNDLGHPMCGNLRDGNWMIDYMIQRLQIEDSTKELGQWMENNFVYLKNIPRYLVPSYFDFLVTGVYILLLDQCYALMSNFVKHGSTFVRALSLGSVQLAGVINSASLPILSPNLLPPKPLLRNVNGKMVQSCVTLSAGLPHFSTGYMRSWGRDTFIALRGLFILTGRYEDARYHILGYAACLRHGLIPNLLDGGKNSRFNCRDAVWWWLYCIKCYVEEAPNGVTILSDKVSRIFPSDDSPPLGAGVEDQVLYEVIQESLRIHFQGLQFRERNAGRKIDAHMTDNGFNNQIGVHPETGFPFGGNEANCGTWMDKMGSSDKAGNRGKPATPRDGSAVELVGLAMAVISWLDKLYVQKVYPYQGVQRTSKNGTIISWTFKAWAEKIQNSFERHFWIDLNQTDDETRSDLVNKRGIYKDCYGASQEWTDFQLRCNFPITMVVAPELFNTKHAWVALQKAEKYLLGPLGMKTLDPEDWAYCGDYNNADDSNTFKTAHGLNYHQGPEWVWPIGFFLRARLHFAEQNDELARTVASTKVILSKHFTELQASVWRGLPELTNSNGAYCRDSCRTQAWSMSCILEVLHDLQRIESKQKLSKN